MNNTVKLLFLLLATSCAPPKHNVACINLDPANGICRDAELRQAERNEASAARQAKAARVATIKQAVQLANTQLADKKSAIVAEQNPQVATRLRREHDALVAKIVNYLAEALFLGEDLGIKPEKIGTHEQLITLHLKQDTTTHALLPVLGGLDKASAVQVSYQTMQHKFPRAENSPPQQKTVTLPATLHIPLHMQFTLNRAIYCGTIAITAERYAGGEVETQLALDEGC